MPEVYIKKDDTAPRITATLLDGNGDVVNLNAAQVRFHMARGNTLKVNGDADIEDSENGEVSYEWQPGDTDTAGIYRGEFQVTFSDASVETFPNNDYFIIRIKADLDEEGS